jgi:hypothetical protein
MKKIIIFGGILFLGTFIGWIIGVFSRSIITIQSFSTIGITERIIYFIFAFLLVIFIHEFGHVLGGKLAGYSLFMFAIGPIKWVRKEEKIQVHWNPSLNSLGGITIMLPKDKSVRPSDMVYLILGGPIAGFIIFIISIGSIYIMAQTQTESIIRQHTSFFLLLVAIMTFIATVGSLLPFRTTGFASDGGQLLDLVKGGNRAERRMILMALSAMSINGNRPKELDPILVNLLLKLSERQMDQMAVAAHHLAYYHYLDLDRIDIAGSELDQALDLKDFYPAELQPGLWLEKAYFEARYGNDVTSAEESLNKGIGGFVEVHTRERAKAAVALAKGDMKEARIAIDLALKKIDNSLDKGGAKAENEWIQEMNRKVIC